MEKGLHPIGLCLMIINASVDHSHGCFATENFQPTLNVKCLGVRTGLMGKLFR